MWFWCSLKQCSRRLSIEICPRPAHSMTLVLIRLSVQWLIHRQRGSVTNRSNCLWFRNLLPTEFYERFASSRVKSGSPRCATWATKDVVVIVTEVCLPEITRRIGHEIIQHSFDSIGQLISNFGVLARHGLADLAPDKLSAGINSRWAIVGRQRLHRELDAQEWRRQTHIKFIPDRNVCVKFLVSFDACQN